MWVYSAIRMHARRWYNWWQRTCNVRYIAPGPAIMITREHTSIQIINERLSGIELVHIEDDRPSVVTNIEKSTLSDETTL